MNAISYFLNKNSSVANDYCKLYFDFNYTNSSTSGIRNLSGYANYSGNIANFNSNFWTTNSGSGYFSGNKYISITGNKDSGVNLDPKDITFCLVYEHQSPYGAILISSLETGSYQTYTESGTTFNTGIYKGFNFGLSSNNRLFFEYYNNNQLKTYTSNFSLAQKASVFLSILDNTVTLGYYDFFSNQLIDEYFYLDSNALFDYSSIYLGANMVNTKPFFKNTYTGYMDEFLIFSPSIFAHDLISINSGFVYSYNTGSLIVTDNSITGITGYTTGITGYITGITGVVAIPTGYTKSQWGVKYTGYFESGISGAIPLIGNIALTGVIQSNFVTGISGSGVSKMYGYMNSFGKNVINFLSTIDSEDFLEMQLLQTNFSGAIFPKNVNCKYLSYSNEAKIPDEVFNSNTGQFLVFVNGQLQQTGISYFTGNGYTSGRYIVNDYIANGNKLNFKNIYNENDSIFIDYVHSTGLYKENFAVTGATNVLAFVSNNPSYTLYFNGQKLSNTLHYFIIFAAGLYRYYFPIATPLFSGATGKLIATYEQYSYVTGNSGVNTFIFNDKYLYNLSQTYKNGIRQTLGVDYLELPSIDTNTGKGFFEHKSNFIYNNEGLFNI